MGYNFQFSSLVIGAEGEFGYDGRNGGKFYSGGARTADFDGDYVGRI